MWPLVVAGAVGFLAAGRTQPKTKCERKVVLGAHTGRTYEVEEFPEAGFLVVRTTGAAASAYGVFQHVQPKAPGDPRFSWRGGKGANESLHGMCLDLGIVREEGVRGPGSGIRQESGSAPNPGSRVESPGSRAERAPSNVVQHPSAQKATG